MWNDKEHKDMLPLPKELLPASNKGSITGITE
jgi:hypothetical protein